MMPNLDATASGANSNSFITLDEASDFAQERLYADAWTEASEENQIAALIYSCHRLSQELFKGVRTTEQQALPFPRYGITDRDGYSIQSTVIPKDIKRAQFALALVYLGEDTSESSGLDNFKTIKVGPITIQPEQPQDQDILPPDVDRLISFYLSGDTNTIELSL